MDNSDIVLGRHARAKRFAAQQLRRDPTPAEAKLWCLLRANRLGGHHFRRQQIIDGFIVDFYCHASGLVVEVDGGVHDHTTEYDAERGATLASRGLRVIRFRNEQVLSETTDVLAAILAELGHGT